MENIKNIQQTRTLLDGIFAELTDKSVIVVNFSTKTGNEKIEEHPFLESFTVNGFDTLESFQEELSRIFKNMAERYFDAIALIPPQNHIWFFSALIKRGMQSVYQGKNLLDVYRDGTPYPDNIENFCFFDEPEVRLNGKPETDFALSLASMLGTKDYAYAWFRFMDSVHSLLKCTCCMICPYIPGETKCSIAGSNPFDGPNCPKRFIESLSYAYAPHELTWEMKAWISPY